MNSLSDYVLLEIFEKLDENSLLKATTICQRWSQLITSSTSLLKRFTLLIVVSNDQSFRVYGKMHTKNPQNLVIKSLLEPYALSAEFLEHLRNYRETARNLTLKDFLLKDIISTLNHFNLNNITKLVLIYCKNSLQRGTVIEMPNLSHLELHSSVEFVSVIRVHCVKVLKISNLDNYRSTFTENNFEILSLFLKTCNDLKDLTLSKVDTNSPNFNLNFDQFKFNLVSLTVEITIINNLQEFLLSQKSSLRNLAIKCQNQNVELMKVILNDLDLTQLEMSIAIMPNGFPFINKNTTIKKLIIRNEKSSHHRYENLNLQQLFELPNLNHLDCHLPIEGVWNDIFTPYKKVRKIISLCSAVEEFSNCDIDCDVSVESLLTLIHRSMANLKILKLSNVPNFIPSDVYFVKLQCLEIGRIDNEIEFVNLTTLISHCGDLKIIKVKKLNTKSDPTKNILTIVEKADNLKEIHIGCLPSNLKKSIKSLFEEKPMKNIKFCCDSSDTSINDEYVIGQVDKEMIGRFRQLEEWRKYPLNIINY